MNKKWLNAQTFQEELQLSISSAKCDSQAQTFVDKRWKGNTKHKTTNSSAKSLFSHCKIILKLIIVDEYAGKILLLFDSKLKKWTNPAIELHDDQSIKEASKDYLLKKLYVKIDSQLINPPFYLSYVPKADNIPKSKTSYLKNEFALWIKINLKSTEDFNVKEALKNGFKWVNIKSLLVAPKIFEAMEIRGEVGFDKINFA
jgi:hypothetical protein